MDILVGTAESGAHLRKAPRPFPQHFRTGQIHACSDRRSHIEYKAGWNPDAVLRTVCAFANDFENLGGGYVVIGQDCDADGQAVFPPVGIPGSALDKIQRELLACCQLIQPPYFPVLTVAEV